MLIAMPFLVSTLMKAEPVKCDAITDSGKGASRMSQCLHCEINELLESRLQNREVNLAEVAAKVTEVLADLILMADILANVGSFALEKKEDPDLTNPRRSSH